MLCPNGWGNPMLGRRSSGQLLAEPSGAPASPLRWAVAGSVEAIERDLERGGIGPGRWYVAVRVESSDIEALTKARALFAHGWMPPNWTSCVGRLLLHPNWRVSVSRLLRPMGKRKQRPCWSRQRRPSCGLRFGQRWSPDRASVWFSMALGGVFEMRTGSERPSDPLGDVPLDTGRAWP